MAGIVTTIEVCEIVWNAPSDPEILEIEWVRTNDAATGSGYIPGGTPMNFNGEPQTGRIPASQNWIVLHKFASDASGRFYARPITKSGAVGLWSDPAGVYGSFYSGLVLSGQFQVLNGNIAEDDRDDVRSNGLRIGDPSNGSVKQIIASHGESTVVVLSGGSPTESFTISLNGFTSQPTRGSIELEGNLDANIQAVFDFDNGGNSSGTAYITVATVDGSNLPGGARRFGVKLEQY